MPTIYSGSADPTNAIRMTVLGTVTLEGAEITAYDAASKRFFVTSADGLQIVDATDPTAPTLLSTIAISTLSASGGDVTSVAVKNGIVAVSVPDAIKTNVGKVVLLNAADGTILGSYTVGALPDMVTFSPDGKQILVANEGEPLTDDEGTLTDPVGRISIIDITSGPDTGVVTNVGFAAFNSQQVSLVAAGLRIDAGKTVAQALEPEYIAIAPDGLSAVITLQENNAFALLDLATNTITSIVPLGTKDHGLAENAADFSDRDTPGSSSKGIIDIQPAPGVQCMYMPDAIASFSAGGQTYYVTANEGDAYDGFGQSSREDAIRVGAATLDPELVAAIVGASATDEYVTEADIKNTDNLGRLNVSKFGDTDGDGDLDQLLSYGGRSFSIWDATGTLVFDSGSLIERATAALTPTLFNANDGVASKFDERSDDKAAEPEGVTVGTIGGKTYAFVALERAGGGVMSFDITDPANVSFAQYARNDGDISAEGVAFISAESSPNGKNIVAVSNEVSGTLTLYQVEQPFTLQLLHFADGEAGLLAGDTAPLMAALVDAFDDDYANTLILAGGDNFLPGPFLAAGTDASVAATHNKGNNPGAADIEIHNRIGVEASTIGNHEFDLGTNAFSDVINDAAFPYLSANLDFSADRGFDIVSNNVVVGNRYQETVGVGGLENVTSLAKKIVPSAVVEKGGETIGLVGATTQILETISSTGNVEVKGFAGDGSETNDMVLLAQQLQLVIDDLIGQGVNKIILMAHLQQIGFERALAPLLTGVDIILAAGSNTRLGDADDVAVSFPGHAADFADTYPIVTAGADGKPTLIVNTDNEYTYLGRLVVEFDSNGEIILESLDELVAVNGAYASTVENVAAAWGDTDGDLSDTAFAEGTKGEQVADITEAVDLVIQAKDGSIAGYTNVYLEGERNLVRNQETNLGNITADANLNALSNALGDEAETTFVASLKNGGGIRAQIGAIDVATGAKEPPLANTNANKPEGAVSQLDIENSLRFNNGLMAFDTTASGLKAILEHGVASLGGQGRFPQIGGISFAFDKDLPAGSRVTSIALIDENDKIVAVIVENGVVNPNAPASITMVTLNFLANGGDGYPMKANGENFRFLLNDGTLSEAIDEALNFTAAGVVPANLLGEQQAMTEYMQERYATPETAFDVADTDQTGDTRIQNLDFREDTVLESIIVGTEDGETIEGSAAGDVITALGGDDIVRGGDGDDMIDGGTGADTMIGGAGDDTYVVDNAGDIVTETTGQGTDTVETSLTAYTLAAHVDNLVLTTNANVVGKGNALANTVTGGDGNDSLFGGAGNVVDTLIGGIGNDYLTGGFGNDVMIGGVGNDTYVIVDDDVVVEVAGEGTDWVNSNTRDLDLADYANVENARILSGDFDVSGDNLANTLRGGAGDNVIIGRGGQDRLYGEAGSDTFKYEALSDSAFGGANRDVIYDFVAGEDLIDLSAIDAIVGSPVDDAFTLGGSTFSKTAGEVRVYQGSSGNYTYVDADVNGDGKADLQITLVGAHTLQNSDFIL